MNRSFTIQQMSKTTGLSVHTLRYYERIGLLEPVGRTPSGHRRYSDQDMAWCEFLLHLRATGMSISNMKRYTALRRRGDSTATERRRMLEQHQEEIRKKLDELMAMDDFLKRKIARYKELEVQIKRRNS